MDNRSKYPALSASHSSRSRRLNNSNPASSRAERRTETSFPSSSSSSSSPHLSAGGKGQKWTDHTMRRWAASAAAAREKDGDDGSSSLRQMHRRRSFPDDARNRPSGEKLMAATVDRCPPLRVPTHLFLSTSQRRTAASSTPLALAELATRVGLGRAPVVPPAVEARHTSSVSCPNIFLTSGHNDATPRSRSLGRRSTRDVLAAASDDVPSGEEDDDLGAPPPSSAAARLNSSSSRASEAVARLDRPRLGRYALSTLSTFSMLSSTSLHTSSPEWKSGVATALLLSSSPRSLSSRRSVARGASNARSSFSSDPLTYRWGGSVPRRPDCDSPPPSLPPPPPPPPPTEHTAVMSYP
mmetsp:Transcript_38472/g.115379  ORF Transcript_38472/g.115379 Transcript_38472/m.115379 type:complete len:354 (-) Transcript_38472:784-1845(-)